MKSIKRALKRSRIVLYILLSLAAVILLMYYILDEAFYLSRNDKVDYPASNITIDRPLLTDISFNNQVEQTGAINKFESSIDKAKHSIDIAVFSFLSDRLRQALVRADNRGVKITMILDISRKSQHNLALANSIGKMTIIDRGRYDQENSRNSFNMHHKFMIVDRGYDNEELTTGSLNFTDIGEKYNESFYMTTNDKDLINVYAREFDILKNGSSGISKLRYREYDPWATNLNYKNGLMEVWMSPGLGNRTAKSRILKMISSATSTIDIMMWHFTDYDLAKALINKAEKGIKIRIITEDSNATSTNSMIPILNKYNESGNKNNIEIILDTKSKSLIKENMPASFNPYFHQHTMLVDGREVVFGTNNWTEWAFFHNDEDILVTNIPYIVNKFQETFDYFYKQLR